MKVSRIIKLNLTLTLFLIVGFLLSSNITLAKSESSFRSGEFLVKFKDQTEIHKIKVDQNTDILSLVKNLKTNKNIEYVEPNYTFMPTAFPNDPLYDNQWYLKAVNTKQAWSKALLTREQEKNPVRAVVAVLDSGVDRDHPDLAKNIWINLDEIADNGIDDDKNGYIDDKNGWDFVSNDNNSDPSLTSAYQKDAINHGTIVSGVIAAVNNNAEGIAGVGWFNDVMPLRVLDSQGLGDVYDVIRAIDYASENGADIINMSFVGSDYSEIFQQAIRRANNNGVVVVAAAGNTDPGANGVDMSITKAYPVCYDGNKGENLVIGVASVNQSLKKSDFSNYGECVDLVAPGEGFFSTQVYDESQPEFKQYYSGYYAGTSLSAPMVSGALGLIKSVRPNASVDQLKDFIINNTRLVDEYNPEFKNKLGSGQLDIEKALEAAITQRTSASQEGRGNYIVAGLGYGSYPQIKVLKQNGEEFKSFYAFSPHFTGVVNIAVGNVDGDGAQEIIASAGNGGGPHIRIFNIEGVAKYQFFAFDESFRGGSHIAIGDINNDGKDEIIVGNGKGGQPLVRIFDNRGNLIEEFLAYAKGFRGGVKVGAGDVDGDGNVDVVVGAGSGGGPHVRVFDAKGKLISQFFAYNQNFSGGINLAVGDLHGDGQAEIIVSVEKDSVPTVRVFNYSGKRLSNFFAFDVNDFNGVNLSVGDIDSDGVNEILAGKNIGADAQIKVFNINGVEKLNLNAYVNEYKGGVRPSVFKF